MHISRLALLGHRVPTCSERKHHPQTNLSKLIASVTPVLRPTPAQGFNGIPVSPPATAAVLGRRKMGPSEKHGHDRRRRVNAPMLIGARSSLPERQSSGLEIAHTISGQSHKPAGQRMATAGPAVVGRDVRRKSPVRVKPSDQEPIRVSHMPISSPETVACQGGVPLRPCR
jgi:hypothetical protein